MRSVPKKTCKHLHQALIGALAGALLATPAWAERPMAVDDAGTMDLYGAKVEFGWSRDDRARGLEAAVGFSPLKNVELEVSFGRGSDHRPSPDEDFRGIGAALKWVPLQAEQGLSAGLKLEIGTDRIDDGPGDDLTVRTRAFTGLAQWSFASGTRAHLNLGREWVRESGATAAANTWGVGVAQPLGDRFEVTAEVFGVEDSRPDRQIGLRYQIIEGLKVSAAVGEGNERSFANAGISWEF